MLAVQMKNKSVPVFGFPRVLLFTCLFSFAFSPFSSLENSGNQKKIRNLDKNRDEP